MNSICQDRDPTACALACARMSTQQPSWPLMRSGLEGTHSGPHPFEATRTDTQEQVGKKGGVSWQNFANWIQLANRCQLDSFVNQGLSDFLVQLAVGSWQKLPTELSHCFYSRFSVIPVVGNSLSLRERKTPDYKSGCLPLSLPWVCTPGLGVGVV